MLNRAHLGLMETICWDSPLLYVDNDALASETVAQREAVPA